MTLQKPECDFRKKKKLQVGCREQPDRCTLQAESRLKFWLTECVIEKVGPDGKPLSQERVPGGGCGMKAEQAAERNAPLKNIVNQSDGSQLRCHVQFVPWDLFLALFSKDLLPQELFDGSEAVKAAVFKK